MTSSSYSSFNHVYKDAPYMLEFLFFETFFSLFSTVTQLQVLIVYFRTTQRLLSLTLHSIIASVPHYLLKLIFPTSFSQSSFYHCLSSSLFTHTHLSYFFLSLLLLSLPQLIIIYSNSSFLLISLTFPPAPPEALTTHPCVSPGLLSLTPFTPPSPPVSLPTMTRPLLQHV